jgi:hypothetical protein
MWSTATVVFVMPMTHAQTQENEEEERVVAEIKKLKGVAIVDNKKPGKPLVGIDMTGSKQVTDAWLEKNVKGLTHLRMLDLRSTAISNEGLAQLKGLTELESLTLWARVGFRYGAPQGIDKAQKLEFDCHAGRR